MAWARASISASFLDSLFQHASFHHRSRLPARTPRAASLRRGRPPSKIVGELTEWLKRDSLPFWSTTGWDAKQGGFHERCDFRGRPDASALRRTRVQWRQIYVLAHASMLGWHDGLRLAFQGLEHMLLRAWSPDGKPGFVEVLNPDGSVAKAHRDSYDHAFALLALGWLARPRAMHSEEPARRRVRLRARGTDRRQGLPHRITASGPAASPKPAYAYVRGDARAGRDRRPSRCADGSGALPADAREDLHGSQDTALLLEFFDDQWKPVEEDGASLVEPAIWRNGCGCCASTTT